MKKPFGFSCFAFSLVRKQSRHGELKGFFYVYKDMEEKWCVYCGDWYECRDHVIPISYRGGKRDYRPGDTVWCCNECNHMLGNRAFHTIESRAEFLRWNYTRNRRKVLSFPHWEPEEIAELGYNLRGGVIEKSARRHFYQEKLINLELVSRGHRSRPLNERASQGDYMSLPPIDTQLQALAEFQKICEECGLSYISVAKKSRFCCALCRDNFALALQRRKDEAKQELKSPATRPGTEGVGTTKGES